MATIPSDFGANQRHRSAAMHKTGVYPAGVPRLLNYPNVTVNCLLERAAKHVPEQTAIHFLGKEWTYHEIDEAARRFAIFLQQNQVLNGDRVGILLPNCPEYLIALNGIWKSGGVAVAISPLSVAEDVQSLVHHTECKVVVGLDIFAHLLQSTDPHLRPSKSGSDPGSHGPAVVSVSLQPYLSTFTRWGYQLKRWASGGSVQATDFWDAISQFDESSDPLIPVEKIPQSEPAYILKTGGTTGDPKAVTLSHRNIVSNAWQQMYWLGQSYSASSASSAECMGRETMLAVLPFFHSYGMSTMLATGAALGAKLVMLPRFNPRKTLAAIEDHRPTVFHAVPAMLAALNEEMQRRPRQLNSIKWVISGGAPLPSIIANEFQAHSGAQVVEGYGLSEASPVTHVGPLNGTNQLGTIGLPLPDTQCRIVDENHKDLEPGEVGELLVKGPQVMLGYWKNEAATQEVLRDGWLRTGDLARRVDAGFYQIVDRKKDLIITSGFNVYPADVEEVLRDCECVHDVAVIGIPDAKRGEVVKAFIEIKKGHRWNVGQLERFSLSRLAKHRRPKIWEQVTELPRNFLGKVIRRELRVHNSNSAALLQSETEGDAA